MEHKNKKLRKEKAKKSLFDRIFKSNPNRKKVEKGSDPKKKKIINFKRY